MASGSSCNCGVPCSGGEVSTGDVLVTTGGIVLGVVLTRTGGTTGAGLFGIVF